MKLTPEEFKKYIISEVKKIGQSEGWLPIDSNNESESVNVVQESTEAKLPVTETIATVESTEKNVIAESVEKLDNILKNEFETVHSDGRSIEPEDTTPHAVKKLNEEFKRMKHLVDFRSPLLIKD